MTETLYVATQFTAKSNTVERLMDLLQTLEHHTRQEPGCLDYHFYQSTTDPTAFTSFEQWGDAKSEATHWQTEHVREALVSFPQLLEGEAIITKYRQVI